MSKTLEDYAIAAMNALVIAGLNSGAWEDYDDLAKSAFMIAEAMHKESKRIWNNEMERTGHQLPYTDPQFIPYRK